MYFPTDLAVESTQGSGYDCGIFACNGGGMTKGDHFHV